MTAASEVAGDDAPTGQGVRGQGVTGQGVTGTEIGPHLRRAMGNFATGIAVVSTRDGDGRPLALTASSLTSVSVSPPLVLVCLDRDSETVAAIKESGRFAVNILAEHQAGHSTRFASGEDRGLTGIDLIEDGDLPPLLPETLGHLQCEIESMVAAGDQELVVGQVVRISAGRLEDRGPLLFFRSQYSRLHGHLPSEVEPVTDAIGAPAAQAQASGFSPGEGVVTADGPPSPRATVAIVGGGAAGTLTAIQLMRRSAPGLRIVLIDPATEPGPGLAYRTENEHHRLNVPAGQMIGLPDRPFDFLDWVRISAPETQPQEYLPRSTFGRYLKSLLARTRRESGNRVVFEHRRATAIGIDGRLGTESGEDSVAAPSGATRITLDDGSFVDADRIVLALGNGRPGDIPGLEPELVESPHYIRDPWAEGALDQPIRDEAVLLIGTGLTMVDMALSLGGPGGPTLHAVSRHGLLPRAHGDTMPTRGRPVAMPDERCSLTELISRLLTEVAIAGSRGEDWRVAFDSLRPITNDLWRSLDRRDQKRFISDLGRIWGIHRHRMAPRVALGLERLKVNRRLRVRAAGIDRIALDEGRVTVDLHLNRLDAEERLVVDRVINCTGPTWDPRRLDSPLVRELLDQGLLRTDGLGIGFDVDTDGALVGADAVPSDRLYSIGPIRNGVLLETTAVPEIGQQAEQLADHLLTDLAGILGTGLSLSVA